MKETSGIHPEYRIPVSVPREAEHCLLVVQRVVLPVLGVALTSQGSLVSSRVSPRVRFLGWGVGIRVENCICLDGRSLMSLGCHVCLGAITVVRLLREAEHCLMVVQAVDLPVPGASLTSPGSPVLVRVSPPIHFWEATGGDGGRKLRSFGRATSEQFGWSIY